MKFPTPVELYKECKMEFHNKLEEAMHPIIAEFQKEMGVEILQIGVRLVKTKGTEESCISSIEIVTNIDRIN